MSGTDAAQAVQDPDGEFPEPGGGPAHPERVVFCIPVFNDWEVVRLLLERLQDVARHLAYPCGVLLVDDGSVDDPPPLLPSGQPVFASAEVLRLRRNVGHQRAIALGLAFIHRHRPCRVVVVMDGDGQDAPSDAPELIERCRSGGFRKIVFAKRIRRSDRPLFQAGYHAFRFVHRMLTGQRVEVGNFSAVPDRQLERLVGNSDLWNHYAAGAIHSRLAVELVPIARHRRILGDARMSVTDLVIHGLSAISVYWSTVGVRLLMLAAGVMACATVILAVLAGLSAFGGVSIPGWELVAGGLLTLLLLNFVVLSTMFVVFMLQFRSAAPFLPIRDWRPYVIGVSRLNAVSPESAGRGAGG